jgi:hypothetical protein
MSKNGITEQVEDALTYPILTQQVDLEPSTASQAVSVSGGASLDSIAQNTIRRVLGWRYRVGDTKGFTAALTKTFTLKEVEGHVEWEWKPQNYMVQADLGEVTGAQASIYSRAKAAMDQALPLLDGLTPLREDADPEDCNAIRALVRSELQNQLVPELGKPGGPVVQLVEQIFTLLIGSTNPITDLETVGGQLGELRFRFGLERKRVNTVDEEVNLTNFLIVVDYINSLYVTWIAQSKFLGRQGLAEPFLGTQLVFLSQQLEEVAESVREAYDAMDSVFFGPAERQTTQLSFPGQPFITVAELLAWVDKFATVDGPQWLQDSGKDGVSLVATTAGQLYDLVNQASQKSKSGSSNPSRAFHTARVHRAFDVIRDGLQTTFNLANQIKTVDQPRPPKPVPAQGITRVDPAEDVQGKNRAPLTIYGFGLARVTKAYLEPSDPKQQVLSTDAHAENDSEVTAEFDLTDAQPGIYNLILKDPLERQISKKDAFTVTVPRPKVTKVEPLASDQGDLVRLDISGSGFQPNATVTLELEGANQRPSGQITFLTNTQIIVEFDLSSVVEGEWMLIVTNPDGQKSDPEPFTVVLPAPTIDSFVPRFGREHELLGLTIYGHNFRPESAVKLQSRCAPNSIASDDSVQVVGTNTIIAEFDEAKVTPPGQYYVIVTNPGEESAWSSNLLEICRHGPPSVDDIAPMIIDEEEIVRFDIGGSGFQPKASVTLGFQDSNQKPLGEIVFLSDTQIVVDFDEALVTEPNGNLIVTNPDGQKSDPETFQIVLPPPTVHSFAPRVWDTSQRLPLTVRGKHFTKDTMVKLRTCGSDLSPAETNFVSPRIIGCTFDADDSVVAESFYVVVASGNFEDWSEDSLSICQDAGYSGSSTAPELETASEEKASESDGKAWLWRLDETIKEGLSKLSAEKDPDQPAIREIEEQLKSLQLWLHRGVSPSEPGPERELSATSPQPGATNPVTQAANPEQSAELKTPTEPGNPEVSGRKASRKTRQT